MTIESILGYILMISAPIAILVIDSRDAWGYTAVVRLGIIAACAIPVIYLSGVLAVDLLSGQGPGSHDGAPGYPYAACLIIWPVVSIANGTGNGMACFPDGVHASLPLPPAAALLLFGISTTIALLPARIEDKKTRMYHDRCEIQDENRRKARIKQETQDTIESIKSDITSANSEKTKAEVEYNLWLGAADEAKGKKEELNSRLAAMGKIYRTDNRADP